MKKMSRIFLIIFIVFSFLNLLHFKSYASDYTGKVQYSNLGAKIQFQKADIHLSMIFQMVFLKL